MKKRIVSIMLIAVTILTSVFSLAGCKKQEVATITVGQWLSMVDYAFGMESYTSEEPYFSNISSSNPYFDAVQIAAEWDVIDKEGSIDVDKKLTYKEALITLVNVGNFTKSDASDDEKIKYAIQNFDKEIRTYWMNREIPQEDAVILLAIAQNKWETRKYTESIEEITYNDKVVDLSDVDLSESAIGEKTLVVDENISVEEGSVCILPSAENKFEKEYLKVESVSEVDGQKVVKFSDEELELEDIYEEIYIQETLVPTAENTVIYDGNGNIISAGVETTGQAYKNGENSANINLLGTSNNISNNQCAWTNSHTFTVSGLKVTLSYNLDGALDLSASIESDNLLTGDVAKNGHKLTLSTGLSVSNLAVTQKFDWGTEWKGFIPVPKLEEAELKVDYTVKQNAAIKYSKQNKYIAAPAYSNGNGKFLTNFCRAVMKHDNGNVYGAKTIASKKTVKVCSLNVYSVGVAKICLDVNVTFGIEGSVEVSITESGTKGVEYKDGSIRFIKKNTKSYDAQVKAKAELKVGVGPALYVVGLKKKLVGIEAQIGVGVSATLKLHLADSQMHLIEEVNMTDSTPEQASILLEAGKDISADAASIQAVAEAQGGVYHVEAGQEVKLHVDSCVDIKAYFILSVGLTDQSYITQFLNASKIQFSISICNEKNATFLNMHVDNLNWVDMSVNWGADAKKNNCTLNYVPFDKEEDKEDDKEEDKEEDKEQDTEETTSEIESIKDNDENVDSGIVSGERLILSTMNVNMAKGQKYSIGITQLPKGYSKDDIVFSSKNDKIATVDKNGNILAVSEGVTVVTGKTSDGKYSAVIAIIVESTPGMNFEGL